MCSKFLKEFNPNFLDYFYLKFFKKISSGKLQELFNIISNYFLQYFFPNLQY